MTILIVFQVLVFLTLGMLHIYWAIGGRWGFESALPTSIDGKKVLNPKALDSLIVGIGLLLFALFYLIKIEWIAFVLPNWVSISAGWFIASIFLLRALGDFKYVGFFKKIKSTHFAQLDSRYFSPLCFTIGLIGILIEILL